MWEYTDKVQQHFLEPQNVGEIENASGTGDVGSLACGDALKLTLQIDANDIITDAKIQDLWLCQRHCLLVGPHRNGKRHVH